MAFLPEIRPPIELGTKCQFWRKVKLAAHSKCLHTLLAPLKQLSYSGEYAMHAVLFVLGHMFCSLVVQNADGVLFCRSVFV